MRNKKTQRLLSEKMRHFLIASAVVALGIYWTAAGSVRAFAEDGSQFVDITDASGIRFTHRSSPENKYIIESMGGGVVLFDYNNDGCLDIFFTNAPTVDTADQPARSALYRNNCDGTFTDVTERSNLGNSGWAMGAVAADYDGDGYQDLYVTGFGSNHLYHNNGDGTFTDVTEKAGVDDTRWSTGAAFGDFDNDGALDLFVANYAQVDLSNLPQFGKGKYCVYHGMPVQCGPRGLPGAGDSLFHNNGNGTFTEVSKKAGVADPDGRYGLGVVWIDVDGDGWPDLYVANDTGPNFLYHNNHDGTFTEIGLLAGVAVNDEGREQGSMGVAVGDYLHTGRPALFVSNFADEYHTLYRHDRPLMFSDVSFQAGIGKFMGPYVGWGAAFFDYDNDGWPDLIIVHGHVYPQVDNTDTGSRYAQRILLFHNEGNGTFSEVAAQAGEALTIPRVSRGLAIGDLDNDGFLDVVIENPNGKPTILRNTGNRNNWITIKTVGTGLSRDAIGAKIKVVAGDLVQWDEVRSGGSYLSGSDLRLHYGLGTRSRVDTIEIHWPDGKTESIREIPANRFLTIEEGKGLVKETSARVKEPKTTN